MSAWPATTDASACSRRGEEPWTPWSVCLRDHVHQTWLCFGLPDQFTAYAQGCVVPDDRGAVLVPRERPLAELQALREPQGATVTWWDVLRVLDVLERRAPRWVLVGIEATRPASGSPRYRLVDRQEGRDRRREVDSYAVFEQIIEAG